VSRVCLHPRMPEEDHLEGWEHKRRRVDLKPAFTG
jgi:hypothetical protein